MITPEQPHQAEILEVVQETPGTKTFTVRFLDGTLQKKFFFVPGKFMMVSVFGFGEVPISISSSPYETDSIKFTVVDVGTVTHAMHRLKKHDVLGLRGPFGNGFPMQKFRGKDVLFVSGGCGLAPLRSAILVVKAKRNEFGKAMLLSGCKSPEQFLFLDSLRQWEKEGITSLCTVDKPDKTWKGNVGFVTELFSKVELSKDSTIVMMCGPGIMMRNAIKEFKRLGFKKENIYASLERMMQCGVGYCSHCNIGNKYSCIDGPVFSAKDLENMPAEEH